MIRLRDRDIEVATARLRAQFSPGASARSRRSSLNWTSERRRTRPRHRSLETTGERGRVRFGHSAAVLALILTAFAPSPVPVRGFTAGPVVAKTYDAILDADFASLGDQLATTCGPAPVQACQMLDALGLWWQISLDPESRRLDGPFSQKVEAAIAATNAWTAREPERAEAWFYLGAAYGARVQWRVLRRERLAAARDGKRIKDALERALALDPDLDDAYFGIGLYKYYADMAPTFLKMFRWLLLLPGGDRTEGLAEMIKARDRGQLVRGETDYQLHLIYLWYEKRYRDALALVESLQKRYPHNPLFWHLEAEIHDKYFHDARASLAAARDLSARAQANQVHSPALASVLARLDMATALDRLGENVKAVEILTALIAEKPSAPAGAATKAQVLLQRVRAREKR